MRHCSWQQLQQHFLTVCGPAAAPPCHACRPALTPLPAGCSSLQLRYRGLPSASSLPQMMCWLRWPSATACRTASSTRSAEARHPPRPLTCASTRRVRTPRSSSMHAGAPLHSPLQQAEPLAAPPAHPAPRRAAAAPTALPLEAATAACSPSRCAMTRYTCPI